METAIRVLLVLLSFTVHVSLSDKPSDLSQGVFCEGCAATVKEILKRVDKKTGDGREVKVVDAMEDICNLQNFGSYEYSPPKTGQACKYLIENYDEQIENIFFAETEDLEQKICYELTKACEGVDRSKKEKEELEVKINDKKQPIQHGSHKDNYAKESGPETYNVNINEEGAADKLINQINKAIKEKKSNDIKEDEMEDDDDSEEDTENLTENGNEDKIEL